MNSQTESGDFRKEAWRHTFDFLTHLCKEPAFCFGDGSSQLSPFMAKKKKLGEIARASEHALFLMGHVANYFHELHGYFQFLQKIKREHGAGDASPTWEILEEVIAFLEHFQVSYSEAVQTHNVPSFPEALPPGGVFSKGINAPSSFLGEARGLAYLAYHDPLTGLANRQLFYQRVKQALTESAQPTLGVLFLDLDGFKRINDSYGHEVGDWLLCQVSQRLQKCTRRQDTVSRFGGDEFSILIKQNMTSAFLEKVAKRVIEAVHLPYQKEGVSLSIGISIGIALCPENSQDFETLISQADDAMYAVKQSGKGHYKFYRDLCPVSLVARSEHLKVG